MDIQQQESLDLTFTAGQCKLARCTVEQLLKAAVLECIAKEDAVEILRRQDFESVTQEAYGDLKAFASKDPASQRNLEFIARTYTSYAAVLHYQLANYVYGLTLASADSASVLGPVSIGNDAMIGAHCVISEDVPAQHRVTLDGTENVVKSIRPGTRS